MPKTTMATTRRRLSWRDDTDGLATPIGIGIDDDDGRGGKRVTKSFGDAGRVALGELDSNAPRSRSEDEERRMRSGVSKTGSTTTTTTTTYMAGSTPGALSAKHASRLATLRAEEDEEDEDEEEEEESSVLLADDEFSFEFTGNVVDDVATPGGSEDDSGTSDTLVLTSKASRLSRVHETLELFKSLANLAISPPSSSEATRAAPTPANTPASNVNVLLRRFEAAEMTTMDASPVVVRDASMTSARLMSPRHGLIGKIIDSMSLSDAVEIGDAPGETAISTAPRLAAFVILMTVAALMFCSAACATTAVAYAIKSPLRAMMTTPAAKPPRVLVEGAAFAYRWWYRSGKNATRFVLFFKLEDAFASYGAFFTQQTRDSVHVEMAKCAERTIALLRSMSVAFGYCAAFLAFIAAMTQVVANIPPAATGAAMKANDDDVENDDISNGSANGSTPTVVERAYLAARTFVLEPSAKTPPSLASSTQSQSSHSTTPSRLIHV